MIHYRKFLLVPLLTIACVSQQKFDDLAGKNQANESKVKDLDSQLAKYKSDSQAKIDEQAKLIAQLERKLGSEASDKQSLTASIAEMKRAIHEMTENEKETQKRIKEYKDLVSRFQSLIDNGALSIKFVSGKMVVALSSDVLFSSGSSVLSAEGKKAIREVGAKLATIPGKEFQIEGYTDNLPIHNEKFPSNWELASARAVNVINELVDVGVPRDHVSAATFADTKPVKPNDSPEDRALNRRIEIVVVPDLSKLPGYSELNKMK